MRVSGSHWTYSAVRVFLARLLLLAFCLRALVPVGYMPDLRATAAGHFKVVVCSASGTKSITLDKDGIPVPDRGAPHRDEPCAFSTLTHSAVTLFDVVAFIAPDHQLVADKPTGDVQLPPARAGPTLGSRGPPQIS
ncbi:MAG TPA: hypothetical protein PLD46_08425 [Hyphomicrobium sp.]|nr:hypothetical protein [Hyphomicrobium sp.]